MRKVPDRTGSYLHSHTTYAIIQVDILVFLVPRTLFPGSGTIMRHIEPKGQAYQTYLDVRNKPLNFCNLVFTPIL